MSHGSGRGSEKNLCDLRPFLLPVATCSQASGPSQAPLSPGRGPDPVQLRVPAQLMRGCPKATPLTDTAGLTPTSNALTFFKFLLPAEIK